MIKKKKKLEGSRWKTSWSTRKKRTQTPHCLLCKEAESSLWWNFACKRRKRRIFPILKATNACFLFIFLFLAGCRKAVNTKRRVLNRIIHKQLESLKEKKNKKTKRWLLESQVVLLWPVRDSSWIIWWVNHTNTAGFGYNDQIATSFFNSLQQYCQLVCGCQEFGLCVFSVCVICCFLMKNL